MSFLDHIYSCNRHDLSGFRKFWVTQHHVGWVRHSLARYLAEYQSLVSVTDADVVLLPRIEATKSRTQTMAEISRRLVANNIIPQLRDELYPIVTHWGAVPLMSIDRDVVPLFGISAYGIHVNGYVRHPDGRIDMWIARRSQNCIVAPGKFDNLVAGGQPIGLSLRENLIKEAREEADIPESLLSKASLIGKIHYTMEVKDGLKPDTLFIFDLPLDVTFIPHNNDGEVAAFERWPLEHVAMTVYHTDDFKFNCNLVVIDFCCDTDI